MYFTPGWDVVYNSIGDGCKVLYPITMKPSVQWSRKSYEKKDDGTMLVKPRLFKEVVCVAMNKIRCT